MAGTYAETTARGFGLVHAIVSHFNDRNLLYSIFYIKTYFAFAQNVITKPWLNDQNVNWVHVGAFLEIS